jgi:hypothetical protein
MLTQCTSPDAPFYTLDLASLAFADSIGIDLPCTQLIAVAGAGLALVFSGLAILAYVGIAKLLRNIIA